MTPELTQVIGTLGAFFILVAFILNQIHKWKDTDLKYDVVNLIGSALLVWYAHLLQSHPFLILNLVWLVVSFRDVVNDIKRKK